MRSKETLIVNDFTVNITRRRFKRHLTLSVKDQGIITVSSNYSTPKALIYRFVQEKTNWLKKTLSKITELEKRFPPKTYLPGENFLLFGKSFTLKYQPLESEKTVSIDTVNKILRVSSDSPQMAKEQLKKFYRDLAYLHLGQRTDYWSQRMSLYPNKVSFHAFRSQWGSCTHSGSIRLNWKLISAPPAVMDYIIVHELAHLRHFNHSQPFWTLVASYIPDYKDQKRWLRNNQKVSDFL